MAQTVTGMHILSFTFTTPLLLLFAIVAVAMAPLAASAASSSSSNFRQIQKGDTIGIGAIVSSTDHISFLEKKIKESQFHPRVGESEFLSAQIRFQAHAVPMNKNPIRTAELVCDLIDKQVFVVLTPDLEETASSSITYACGRYDIPVIGISNRRSSMSNENLHRSFMRMIEPYFRQADIWIAILKELKYKSVVFIHSSDTDGQSIKERFQYLASQNGLNVAMSVAYGDELDDDLDDKLAEVNAKIVTRVFCLYTSAEDASMIFGKVRRANLTTTGSVFLVSEQALNTPDVLEGAIGVSLNVTREEAYIEDTLRVVQSAVNQLLKQSSHYTSSGVQFTNITFPPANCRTKGASDTLVTELSWSTGRLLLDKLQNQTFDDGATGRIAFDTVTGDRIGSDYIVVNVLPSASETSRGGQQGKKRLSIVGSYTYDMDSGPGSTMKGGPTSASGNRVGGSTGHPASHMRLTPTLTLNTKSILWPGGHKEKPHGYYVPRHLKIVTIEEKPFVWSYPNPSASPCPKGQVACPKPREFTASPPAAAPPGASLGGASLASSSSPSSPSSVHRPGAAKGSNNLFANQTDYCCEGYCIELLEKLAETLNFSYDLYQVSDDSYGSYEFSNDTRVWNGLVADVVSKKADVVVAPLTVNPQRAQVIDFTKPFKYQGIAMIQMRRPRKPKLESFVQPFKGELWLLVFLCVFVVATVLYILDYYSPLGKPMMKNQRLTNEKSLNLSSAIWFSFGVLMNSGISEKTPMSFSARVLGMVWSGFSMIVVASYTANLAAWLVLDAEVTEITGLDDQRLKNPVEGYKYGTVRGSNVELYFRTQVDLQNLHRIMEPNIVRTVDQALSMLKKGEMDVFFWDSPRLDYEVSHDCDYVISGETFGRSAYSIGLTKGSFWTEHVTMQLLDLTESGYMEVLDNKWILQGGKDCHAKAEDSSFTPSLGLETMSGLFFLLLGGIMACLCLVVLEVFYKRHRVKSEKLQWITKKCAIKWLSRVQETRIRQGLAPRTLIRYGKDEWYEPYLVDRKSCNKTGPSMALVVDSIPPPPPPPSCKGRIKDYSRI